MLNAIGRFYYAVVIPAAVVVYWQNSGLTLPSPFSGD